MLPATPRDDADGPVLQVGDAFLPLSPKQWARLQAVGGNAGLTFGIRPEDVDLASADGPQTLAGCVAVLEPQGDTSVVIGDTALGRVSAVVPSELAPDPGVSVRYRFDLARSHIFTADGMNLMLDGASGRGTA
jgi:ABC-type sugar transport system ATPase subunit